MFDYIARLLDTKMLSPHGICLLWRPELLWTHVVSDVLIFSAYMTIPVALAVIINKRRDVPFGWMVWCFALFITACGFTHLMGIWTLWNPDYGVEALVKVVTALASIGTAVALWLLIPLAVSIPTPADLKVVNEELRQRIAERDLAIAELQHEKAQRLKSEEALAQSRKMDALGQLTGGIAHDFNNLLQSVQGSLELIGRRASDAGKVRELADRAMHSAERGAKLTAQLLAFARSKQLKLEPFVVSDFVLGVRDLLGGAAGNMIDLRFGLESGDLAVMADRTQLELALLNLVINARDASPDGGRIVIGARRLDVGQGDADLEPGAYVELSVADTGVGMSPEVRARAFEPFFSTKDVGQGTGLGLSQVYGLARQAGGVARLESAEGQGTVVSLILPITEHAAAAETPRTPQAAAAPRTGLVLVVDDDADVRAFAAAALDTFGHTVLQAPGGGEALASMKAQLPDAVLLDYAMPGMNGAEVARIIARNHPKVPIIFMTGYADAAALEPILGHKATVLRKPFRVDELGYALAGALARGVAGGG